MTGTNKYISNAIADFMDQLQFYVLNILLTEFSHHSVSRQSTV